MLRLIIFDFDGVIADSEKVHFECFREALEGEGLSFDWDEYSQKYLGYEDNEAFYRKLTDAGAPATPELVKQLCQRKSANFLRRMQGGCVIMAGVVDFLGKVRQRGIICAICSGAKRREIEFILYQAKLQDFFAQIVSADDVRRGKPDPEGYLLSLARVNASLDGQEPIRSEQSVVIEDSFWGIEAAHRAGMRCLAVATTYLSERLKDADAVVRDLTCLTVERLEEVLN